MVLALRDPLGLGLVPIVLYDFFRKKLEGLQIMSLVFVVYTIYLPWLLPQKRCGLGVVPLQNDLEIFKSSEI